MIITVLLQEPTQGYWDGGAKDKFEFHSKDLNNGNMKWGSWEANFWFNCAKGKTDKLSVSYAIKRLKHLCKRAIKQITVSY